jgi:hypothetical protein
MFDVDVTTLDAGLIPTHSIRVVIGGGSDWTGLYSGGLTYVTSFAWRSDLNETYTRCAAGVADANPARLPARAAADGSHALRYVACARAVQIYTGSLQLLTLPFISLCSASACKVCLLLMVCMRCLLCAVSLPLL